MPRDRSGTHVNGFIDFVQRLGVGRLIALAAIGVAVFAFFGFFANKLSQPPMGLLYGDLATNDAGQIIAKLEAQNIPVELRAGGTQVWVPQDRALRLRMAMAEQGLPRGGSVGYELFDKSENFGSTNFLQNLNLIRALEGELSRTIGSLAPISGARVHLTLPRRDVFNRDKVEPTASVVLKLRDNNRLPRGQVSAIQHLVASAVPSMKPMRVSVVDDRGNLYFSGAGDNGDGAAGSGAGSSDERRREQEQTLARKIEEQLERAVGPGRVRAEVSLEIDFDRIVTSTEEYNPEGSVERSRQTVNESNEGQESQGNQGVSVTNNLPDGEAGAGSAQNKTKNTRQEETINFETSKTRREHVREPGTIKRLSASVIIDGLVTVGADGKATYQPRNPEQLEQLTTLARSAVGYNEKRGDKVDIVNLQFAGGDLQEPIAPPGMFDLSRAEILRIAELAVLFVVALLVILLVARPLIAAIGRAAAPAETAGGGGSGQAALPNAVGGGQAALAGPADGGGAGTGGGTGGEPGGIDLDRVDGRVNASALKKIGEIVEKHPDEAVAIVRNWMYQEA